MKPATRLLFVRCSALAAVAVLAGCAQQSAQRSPIAQEPVFRQTVQTAPADLQLVCAGEAARTYQVASDRVLPISSSIEGDIYRVVLNADGTEATCIIDEQGNVLSLDRA
jgi:hypothetical protein